MEFKVEVEESCFVIEISYSNGSKIVNHFKLDKITPQMIQTDNVVYEYNNSVVTYINVDGVIFIATNSWRIHFDRDDSARFMQILGKYMPI